MNPINNTSVIHTDLSKKYSYQKQKKKLLWFTLVELIVVISILAILGTISLISFQWFSGSARDSNRVSDINNLSQSLELTSIKTGYYPLPDNSFTITYSGGIIWTQWSIGEIVMNVLSADWAKLNKKPTDPLNQTKEYTYSVLKYGSVYQIRADWEGDNITYNTFSHFERGLGWGFIDQAQASSGNPLLTYIRGTYNGVVTKTETGSIKYILAIPSLFLTNGTGIVILPTNTLTWFYIHGQTNSGGILFQPSLVYSSGSLPSTSIERQTFATALANAYSGTTLATQTNIQPFITALTDTNSGILLVNLGESAITNWLGGGLVLLSSTSIPATNCTTTTYSGVTITALISSTSQNFTKSIAYGTGDVTATCFNGIVAYESINTTCDINYVTSGAWNCIADSCTGSAPTNSQLNGTQWTASWNYSTTSGLCKFQCQAGYYWNGIDTCIVAAAGNYVATAGLSNQTACTIGTYQNSTGQISCSIPTVGYWASPINNATANISQTQCLAGTYCNGWVKITTTAGNYTSTAGAISQTQCPENSYCPAGSGTPTACGGGFISPAGSTNVGSCVAPPINGACDNTTIFACLNGSTSVSNVANSCGQSATWGCDGLNLGTSTTATACSKANTACRYTWCNIDDIILSNGQIWAACNIGSSVAWTTAASYGSYIQWGRNDGWWTTTGAATDWQARNDNSWGGGTTTKTAWTWATVSAANQILMKGPCIGSYHIPTDFEWVTAVNLVTGKTSGWVAWDITTLQNTLKLPTPGHRSYSNGSIISLGKGYYWSSSPNTTYSYYLFFSTAIYPSDFDVRAFGKSVRCLKN